MKSFQVTKIISFCYGHRLLKYDGKCKYLHGHNGFAEILLESSSLDRRGMVVDFTDVKNVVGTFINEKLDHKMLLNKKDRMTAVLKKMNFKFLDMKYYGHKSVKKTTKTWMLSQRNLPKVKICKVCHKNIFCNGPL